MENGRGSIGACPLKENGQGNSSTPELLSTRRQFGPASAYAPSRLRKTRIDSYYSKKGSNYSSAVISFLTDAEPGTVLGILLAAGASTRLGHPKQLVTVDGEPLVARTARRLLTVADKVVVVTGAHHMEVLAALDGVPVRAIFNPRWQEGMSASIRQGVSGAALSAQSMLLMLVDQPHITGDDLTRLVTAWRQHPDRIAAADYGGVVGVPAIFPGAFRDKLLGLHGDRGAQPILMKATDITRVEMPHAAFDLDTPADLGRI